MPVGGFTIILTNYDELGLDNLVAYYVAPPAGCFREEDENIVFEP